VREPPLTTHSKRALYALWLVFIVCFAVLHALNLRADFPNHSPWMSDWAKFTDEGWYGSAAIRAHLFGNWYMQGDFNPAVALPVWPLLEWVLFFFTGVTIEAVRGLAVTFFFVNLLLSYLLLRARGTRWMALLALTLIVTSPFLYCFSRLAILEPSLTAFMLAALNLAVRLPGFRRPLLSSVFIGLFFTLMMLCKTTAVFLLPALGWAMVLPLVRNRRLALQTILAATAATALSFGLWMLTIDRLGLFRDYKYLFFVNKYIKPQEFYWPLVSFWWSLHGSLWADHFLLPLAALVIAGALLACRQWGRRLLVDPVFGSSVLAIAGYIFFMTVQNHPQPRYFAVAAFFAFFVVAQGAEALLGPAREPVVGSAWPRKPANRLFGWAVVGLAGLAAAMNGVSTVSYAAHPEYTFVTAAQRLTQYIDAHPNGKRLLVSISGDQITLATHLPTICDDFGTMDLVSKLNAYQPGWFATWNDIDPGTLEDLHNHYTLEQVAAFRAFDHPERNVLVLFKLHPLPAGKFRDPSVRNLQVPLPGDTIDIPIQ